MTGTTAAVTIAVATALDLSVEELPERIHPVALFGRLVEPIDRPWPTPRLAGAIAAFLLPLVAAVVAGVAVAIALAFNTAVGIVAAALTLFSTISLRMLLSAGAAMIDLTDADLGAARESAIALVGRETDELSAEELRSAAVESLAENLADGLVGPLFAFAIGSIVSLPVAVGAAAWVKAVNTMDSMLGYRSKPHGWASARLDDLVMWLPARIAAACIAIAGRSPAALRRARSSRRKPASPNSGWPMATIAAVLDIRLHKPGAYTLNPGDDLPTIERAREAVRIVGIAGIVSVAFAMLLSGLLGNVTGYLPIPGVITWY